MPKKSNKLNGIAVHDYRVFLVFMFLFFRVPAFRKLVASPCKQTKQ